MYIEGKVLFFKTWVAPLKSQISWNKDYLIDDGDNQNSYDDFTRL